MILSKLTLRQGKLTLLRPVRVPICPPICQQLSGMEKTRRKHPILNVVISGTNMEWLILTGKFFSSIYPQTPWFFKSTITQHMLIMLTVVSDLNLSRTQASLQLKEYLVLFFILHCSVLELWFLFLNMFLL